MRLYNGPTTRLAKTFSDASSCGKLAPLHAALAYSNANVQSDHESRIVVL